ncbi:MAG: ABC transporter ATP-binding protein [Planctomycetia bacterium]|nr:ABC transporter ATP-binding protein [Planctomycetia bacterium]
MLEVDDLRKLYGPTVALEGVSFQVEAGEMFGLLGPNGAGKTTLLSILSCLLPASGGEARILGRRVGVNDPELRRQIGIVPQELALYGELTARENLAFFGGLYGMGGADLKQRCDEVLAAVALSDRAEDRTEAFSGGMKRRLNLGVALMHRPRLIMLDEPTTGVDPQSRNHIFEEVKRLNAAGVTVVYTSHYMEEVQSLCKRVGIIDHGKLIACDDLSALLRRFEGLIQLRLRPITATLRAQLEALPGVRLSQRDEDTLELQCADVKGTLVRVVPLLNDQQVELLGLESEEPNLERVFLHLTGRALRD